MAAGLQGFHVRIGQGDRCRRAGRFSIRPGGHWLLRKPDARQGKGEGNSEDGAMTKPGHLMILPLRPGGSGHFKASSTDCGASWCSDVCQPSATFSLVTANAGATMEGGFSTPSTARAPTTAMARPCS